VLLDCYLLMGYRAAPLAINSGRASQKMPADQMEEKELSDPAAAANYIASLAGDLAAIARGHGLDTLGYLLDMARLEAENTNSRGK
jgi:hypothetical protein